MATSRYRQTGNERNSDDQPVVITASGMIRQTGMSRTEMMRTITVEELAKSSMYIVHPTTYLETLMNMIRVYMGNGLFAMPYAFKSTGLFLGIGFVVVFMLATVYCNHTLINCCEEVKKRGRMKRTPDMSETIYLSFIDGPDCFAVSATSMRKAATSFIIMNQFLICCVTIVFVGVSFKMLFETYQVPKVHVGFYLAAVTIPMLLTSLIKELKYLAPVSMIANVFLCIGTFIVLYIVCQNLPKVSARTAVGSYNEMPIFFGTFLFAVAGVGMTIPFRSQMMVPENFDSPLGVLNLSMIIYAALLIAIGFLGYLNYGESVKGSIILNLPPSKIAVQIVQFAIATSIMFSYALQFYLVHLLLYTALNDEFGPFESDLFEVFMRIILVLFSLICAELMPNLGLIISLSGALTCSALLFFFPQISDISLRWPSKFGCLAWRLFIDIFMMLLAVVCLVTGVYVSIRDYITNK